MAYDDEVTSYEWERRCLSMPRREADPLSDAPLSPITERIRCGDLGELNIIENYVKSHGRAGARVCLEFIYRDRPDFQKSLKQYFERSQA